MFGIDGDGIIFEARKLEGTTAFARVKPLPGFEGRYIGDLKEEDGPEGHKNLRRAIEDAALTYRKYTAGELVEDTRPQGPIDQALDTVKGLLGRAGKKVIAR